jgi:hypothetical protein
VERDAKRFDCREVDHQPELVGLLNRESSLLAVGGIDPLRRAVDRGLNAARQRFPARLRLRSPARNVLFAGLSTKDE